MSPNKEYLELNYVAETATGLGDNRTVIMESLGNDFKVTEGQVGIKVGRHKPKTYILPMSQWERFYESRIERHYIVTKTKKMGRKEIKKAGFNPIEDPSVKEIVDRILQYAATAVEEAFSVTVDDISEEMMELGKTILDELALNYKSMEVSEFNNKLKMLYQAIPRRIARLSSLLAMNSSEYLDIIDREQELFDVMVSQVKMTGVSIDQNGTVLDAYGLTWRRATDDEVASIRKKMAKEGNRLKAAWRIENKKTEKAFNDFCKKNNLTDVNGGINHCFHGSRSENFWSIITNGLVVNPTGVVITGKAFGNGTYFAIDACKSMGYTCRSGSCWAHGNEATGFMGIYKVATGKEYVPRDCDSSLNWTKLQSIAPGSHCTWYHAGGSVGFRMDEIVVYQNCQDTIEYLLEVGM